MAVTQPFMSLILEKKCGKIWSKSFFNPKNEVIFEIFEKKKCDFMCYTWYETIQHWHHWHCCWWQKVLDPRLVLQKISQYCPETRNLRVSTMRYTASSWCHIKFSKICLQFDVGNVRRVSKVFFATSQVTSNYRQCRQIS